VVHTVLLPTLSPLASLLTQVRFTDIVAARDSQPDHDLYDLSAFNTDGFDVTGRNVWIHDCSVWNQDDCIAVKDDASGVSEDMLFERITASGVGLTIGSIGGSTVRNITFRDCYMPNTFKGLYLKFRASGGLIEDILSAYSCKGPSPHSSPSSGTKTSSSKTPRSGLSG
jgi:polygalacturonase